MAALLAIVAAALAWLSAGCWMPGAPPAVELETPSKRSRRRTP